MKKFHLINLTWIIQISFKINLGSIIIKRAFKFYKLITLNHKISNDNLIIDPF